MSKATSVRWCNQRWGSGEEFLGELSDPEKYELMGDAIALLNPIQWHEPFGLVMIEALATGTPVLATAMGAAPEIVRHGITGFVGSTRELAACLEQVPSLSRDACRRSVEESFSSERMAADHLDVYARLIGQFKDKGLPVEHNLQDNQRQAPINR